MPEHKWARFKRLFGADPNQDLVDTRSNKVKAALAAVKLQIDKLETADLPRQDLQDEHNAIEQQRTNALALTAPKARCEALKPVKKAARALVPRATDIAALRLAANARVKVAVPLIEAARKRTDKAFLILEKRNQEAPAEERRHGQHKESMELALANTDMLGRAARLEAVLGLAQALATDVEKLAKAPKPAPVDVVPEEEPTTLEGAYKAGKVVLGTVQAMLRFNKEEVEKTGRFKEFKKTAGELSGELEELADDGPVEDLLDVRNDLVELHTAMERAVQDVVHVSAVETLFERIDDQIRRAEAVMTALTGLTDGTLLRQAKEERARIALLDTAGAKVRPLETLHDSDLLAKLGVQVRHLRDVESGLKQLLTYIGEVIGELDPGKARDGFQARLDTLEEARGKVLKTPDITLDGVHDAFADLRDKADVLLKETSFNPKGKEGYTKALKGRFGIDLTSDKWAWVNVESAYKMLSKIPDSHVGHDKLQKLHFASSLSGAGGTYGASRIDIARVPDLPLTKYMQVEGERVVMNAFNQTMLHEIGHAVDDNYNIMAKGSGPGFADWQTHGSDDSVLSVFVSTALGRILDADDLTKEQVTEIVTAAFADTKPSRPHGLSDEAWAVAKSTATKVRNSLSGKKPWYNAKAAEIAVGGRVYHQVGNLWSSFLLSARKPTYVSNYQWKAPAEWFAEIYGLSWEAQRRPPSGVDAIVASYCFGGKAPQPEL